MWGLIVASVSMVVVLMTSITLYMQQEKLKTDVNTKLNSVVDQINDSQLYEYNFDKQQEGNIKNVDQNISTLYDAVVEAQKNVNFLKNTTVTRDQLSQAFQSDQIKTNILTLGQKFSLSGIGDGQGNDDWLRLSDKTGTDYYGGLALKHLWNRDNAWFNGTTTIRGTLNVDANSSFKGAKSEFNPNEKGTYFPSVDGKNYISGDTELLGKVNHKGILQSEKVKIGHQFGNFTDNCPLSVFSTTGKWGASFGSEGGLWSHFPHQDQSTYIRPGRNGAAVYIGDQGAATVSIGKGDTSVQIKGDLNTEGQICINNNCITAEDIRKLKALGVAGLTGRYIRVFADDNLIRTLHLTEIQVFDASSTNVAASKTCSSSTIKDNNLTSFGPSNLTDGKVTSKSSTGAWQMAWTSDQAKPWFEIDLGQDYSIKKIKVFNRDDCCQDKFIGFKVAILNGSKQAIYTESITDAKGVYDFSF